MRSTARSALPGWIPEGRAIGREAGRLVRRGDLAGAAATVTYFAGIAIVPWVLLSIWSTTWFSDADEARRMLLGLRVLLPPDMGARPVYDAAVRAGTDLHVVGALVMLFPATFYGEGLRRGCLGMYDGDDRFTGWRARLSILALLVLIFPATWVYTEVGERLTPWSADAGAGLGGLVLRVWLGFLALWIILSIALAWVFWRVTPGRPSAIAATVGALTTASFIAGFIQGGFALFLSIGIDVGIPYGGLSVVGGVVAVGLWLWILHMLLIVGWAGTLALHRRHLNSQPPAVVV